MTEEYTVKNIVIKTPAGEFASPFVKPATSESLGTIKPDNETIIVAEDGTLSANIDIDLSNLINVTYSELVELKATSQLQEGAFYRITDYITTTNGNSADTSEPSRSAGHQFDIIIQALGSSNLSDIGTCALHEGDTYFASQNLGAWQVWYDIENNTSKYAWAVTDGTGKGVIYRMIDEHQNDLPYDFKNIQFYRDSSLDKYKTIKSVTNDSGKTIKYMRDVADYYYTFSDLNNDTITDLSIEGNGPVNHFKIAQNRTGDSIVAVKNLNNLVTVGTSGDRGQEGTVFIGQAYNSTIGSNFSHNTIGNYFYNNIIGPNSYGNNIGGYCYNNTVGYSFYSNSIGANFQNNIVGERFYGNTIGAYFQNNTVGLRFYSNSVGSPFTDNIIGERFYCNNIGAYFRNNNIGNKFYHNTTNSYFINNIINSESKFSLAGAFNIFGARFSDNIISGDSFMNNTFGCYIYTCSFQSPDYAMYDCTIGSDSKFLSFDGEMDLMNIEQRTSGSSATNKLNLKGLPVQLNYPIRIKMDKDKRVLATWEDNGVTVGKVKSSATATTWTDLVPKVTTSDWDD